jgi:hypothetical protein
MLALFILIVVDYLVTYIGITMGVITEANPLMRWLFNLHLWPGIAVRAALALSAVGLLSYARKRDARLYRSGVAVAYAVQAAVMGLHLYWVSLL